MKNRHRRHVDMIYKYRKCIYEVSKYVSLTVLLLFVTIGMVSAAGLSALSIGGDKQGAVGDYATIYINATGANNLGSLQLDVLYDKSIISANSVMAESLTTGGMFVRNIDNTLGKITIGMISTSGITGNGPLAKISYNITKSGVSKLEISGAAATDVSNGVIIIGSTTGASFSAIGQTSPSDTIPPVTILSGATEGAIYKSDVTIQLTATDNVGGSGVEGTIFTVNGGPVVPYGAPFVVSSEGLNTIIYSSMDNAGNAEKSKQISFTIDKGVVGNVLAYYRGLGQYPSVVETSDLLKAADDWRDNIIPPGFSAGIITDQLLTLADEWRNS
jgi:hypothetical protein